MNKSFTRSQSITSLLLFCLCIAGIQAWDLADPVPYHPTNQPEWTLSAPVVTGAWNRLTPAQRSALQNGGTVPGFNLGLCNASGQAILADISAAPASLAPDPATINTRLPRRWGNTSFYLALEDPGPAGVQYCFTLNTPAAFIMDSREHAFFSNSENIHVKASNAGAPVDLFADLQGTAGSASFSGSGTAAVHFSANGQTEKGTWWSVHSAGQPVTEICIQYYSPGAGNVADIEPFRLLLEGTKCVADDPYPCTNLEYISRWNHLSANDRFKLENSIPVYDFNTGFCDESATPIHFLEISASYSPTSGNPEKNAHPPRPYGRYSFDNGREYVGNGGSLYCFTFEEAVPFNISSDEHRFFSGTERIHLSAYLGNDPVPLSGFNYGGGNNGPVSSPGTLVLNGGGYGAGNWWTIGSAGKPVSQVCVEYYVVGGVPLGHEPFALAICADRCLYDDFYACDQNQTGAPGCAGLTDIEITKEVFPVNEYGLNTCSNASGGVENPVMGVRLTMRSVKGTIKNIFLEEDLLAYFGAAYVDTVMAPVIINSTATSDPVIDPLFDGRNWTNLFISGTGALYNGQQFTVEFSVELNPNAPGALNGLINTAYGGGEPSGAFMAQDLSGNLSQGWGTPTPVPALPPGYTATTAQDLTLEATLPNYMNGIQPWLNNHGGAQFSLPGCNSVVWTNDYHPSHWVQGCGQLTGSVEVTFTANACGTTFTTCATFSLEDTKGPTCTKPDDLDLDCGDPDAAAILLAWLEYDGPFTDLSQPVTFSNDFTGLTGNECNGDSILVTWTATDACGNETVFSAYLTVTDDTAPVMQGLPSDLTLDPCDAVPDTALVTAIDGCDTDVQIDFEETVTGDSCHLIIERTWTATDDCDNTSSFTQTIHILDEDPPVFTNVAADLTIECPDTIPAAQDPDVSDCSGFSLSFEEMQIGGVCPQPSQVIRTWIATDDCGNADTVVQVIQVVSPGNAGVLVFVSDPQDTTLTCDQFVGFDSVMAETTCPQGGLSISYSDVVNSSGDCSEPFSVTRTWTAHDSCGNVVNISQTINIGPDTLAPVFDPATPDTLSVDCGGDVVTPDAFDNCGTASLSYMDTAVIGSCDTGFAFFRIWTATDLCGNTASFSQVVMTGPDTTAPAFTFVPADQYFDCDDTIVFELPQAIDNCGGVTFTWQDSLVGTGECNEVNGQLLGYEIIRTWTASDDCGNSTTAVTSAIVVPGYNSGNLIGFTDVPENRTIGCGDVLDFGQVVCHSACGELVLTFEDVYDTDCVNGTTVTRTWTATDECGNTATAVQQIFVEPDQEAPVFMQVPADGLFNCNDGDPVFGTPEVTDNCAFGASVLLTYTDHWENSGSGCNGFRVTRTWTATDPCGNSSTASQTLELLDNVAPSFDLVPADKQIGCGDPVVFGNPEVTDACANPVLTFTDELVDLCGNTYAVIRTWTATDACGNEAVASQTVSVVDEVAPVFDFVPAGEVISCGDPLVFGTPVYSDACSAVSLAFADQTQVVCEGTYTVTRTWTATDACGNDVQASQTITVEDHTAPVFTTSADPLYFQCGEPILFDTPEAMDACGQVTLSYADETELNGCETIVTRTWLATDDCGNESQLSQSAYITDEEAPVVSGLPAQLEMTQAAYDVWQAPDPVVDDCSQTMVDLVVNSESNCEFLLYTYTYTVNDFCGNATTQDLNVLITDAAFDMDLALPADVECGNTYLLEATALNGEAPFSYAWQIVSGTGWTITAVLGESTAEIDAGEGEAVISVTITDANGCTAIQEFTLSCTPATAVEDRILEDFRLMPNPAVDFLAIRYGSQHAGQATLGVVNTLGQSVVMQEVFVSMGENRHELNISSLPAGTYFLVMRLNDLTKTEKFVKVW